MKYIAASFWLAAWLLALPWVANADTLEGTVFKVIEGDTLEVTDATQKKFRFRFLGADAPEYGQTGYTESKRELTKRAEGQKVTVDWIRSQVCPKEGGTCSQLAKVLLRGEDLALRQVARGWAWHDERQLKEQSTTDKILFEDAQIQAKAKKRGIWSRPGATPPWEFVVRRPDAALAHPKKKTKGAKR